jgi:2-aminoadipate transaminase
MINLTRGVPPPEAFPIDELVQSFDKMLKQDGKTLLQYMTSPGYSPLRQWLAEREGVKPEQIFMGNSSLELLDMLTRTEIKPGDRVFVESPSYDRANTTLKRSGAQVVGIPLELDGINLDVFEAELKKGVPTFFYIIADFQNPMGTVCSLAKRRQIARWAQQYGFRVVEDTPYRQLRYHGVDVPTIRSLAPEQVIQMSSVSKLLAPGLRVGYFVGQVDLVKRVQKWATDTYIGPVAVTQAMAYEFGSSGRLDTNIAHLRDLYRPRLDTLLAALDRYLPTAIYPRPEGGFFVGVILPEGNTMDALLKDGLAAGMQFSDGRGFYLNPQDGERFLRLPFCSLTPEEIQAAVEKIAGLIKA